MRTKTSDIALAAAGVLLVVVVVAELSTEWGRGLGFIGLMLIAIAGLSHLVRRGGGGPPDWGGPSDFPHH